MGSGFSSNGSIVSTILSTEAITGGCWTSKFYYYKFPEINILKENYVEENDIIQHIISIETYKCNLWDWQIWCGIFYHEFVVVQTDDDWYYSIEKNNKGILIQRSRHKSDIINFKYICDDHIPEIPAGLADLDG
ncbi:hypothetical protein BLOT_006390 [Blomia tropicalis]|nr:hypothetical protein BLOT_006390 [Blomia tropicalis]